MCAQKTKFDVHPTLIEKLVNLRCDPTKAASASRVGYDDIGFRLRGFEELFPVLLARTTFDKRIPPVIAEDLLHKAIFVQAKKGEASQSDPMGQFSNMASDFMHEATHYGDRPFAFQFAEAGVALERRGVQPPNDLYSRYRRPVIGP